jgi:hypothetical protein
MLQNKTKFKDELNIILRGNRSGRHNTEQNM